MIVCMCAGYIQKLSKVERFLMCWFVFSGLTHIILEGYFVFTPDFYKLTVPNFFAEVCKFLLTFLANWPIEFRFDLIL